MILVVLLLERLDRSVVLFVLLVVLVFDIPAARTRTTTSFQAGV
jgi:hypothetical protein